MNRTGKYGGEETGFTLLELLIAISISTVLMVAVLTAVIQYVNTSSQQSALDDINAEANSLLQVIEKDVMMAGYGLPSRTRIASDFNCDVGDPTFCASSTDVTPNRKSDRLFVADGWQILKAITDTGEDDGKIVTGPLPTANYITLISSKKGSSGGGYSTTLTANCATGDITLSLLSLNVNAGEEFTVSGTDFFVNSAFIIGDNTRVEGHTIAAVTSSPNTVKTSVKDPMELPYLSAATPSVVPAHVWYVRSDPDGKTFTDGSPVYWLYRDNYKVMPNVSSFEVRYGYDVNNDGLQWSYTVPPTNVTKPGDPNPPPASYYSWAPAPGNAAFVDTVVAYDFSSLKEIQINLVIKSVYKTVVRLYPYQKTILLRN